VFTNNRKSINSRANHKLHLAVLAALPMLVMAVPVAHAVTVNSPVAPVGATDNGAGGYTGGTYTLGNGSVQTITGGFMPRVDQTINDSTLSSANVNVIGGSNALDSLNLVIKANTTVTPATAAAILVEDDVIEGLYSSKNYSISVLTNGNSTVTNFGHIINADGGQVGNATALTSAANVGVQLGNDGDALIVKSGGSVDSSISVAKIGLVNTTGIDTAKVYGVNTDAGGAYSVTVEEGGSISASHGGVGAVYAVDGGGASQELTVENSGTISATRVTPLLASSLAGSNVLATALKAKLNSSDATYGAALNALSAQNVGNAAAIYIQEELEAFTLNNHATGILETTGDLTDVLYTRSWQTDITNEGIIRVNGYTNLNKNGLAIASVSDSLRVENLTIDNSGSIIGDIAVVNGNALRYWAIKKYGVAGAELTINSGAGQINSEITNTGSIAGDFYYSNGTHVLHNEAGTITGDINVDQRDTVCGAGTGAGLTCSIKPNSLSAIDPNTGEAGQLSRNLEYTVGADTLLVNNVSTAYNGNFTMHGTKSFTFENSGTMTGNVNIVTVGGQTGTYTNVYGDVVAKENSQITLIPTITASGAGSSLAAPSSNISGIGGTLTIVDAAGTSTADLATVAPKSLVTVHAGEYFKVAENLFGATTPQVDSVNTPLVNWLIAKNAGGNLVIGVDSVNSAATIAGVSATSAAAINGLLTSNTSIGGTVQGLTVAADIEKAGQQLRPEANNASMQATIATVDHVSSVIGGHQDEIRTASNGNSGVSTGEAAQGVGFWMQGFGFKGDQSKRGGIDGYTANTGGFVLGGDTLVGNGDFRVGGAVGYASTGIDGAGVTSTNRTDIDSYQGSLYGSYNAGAWYVDAALGYGKHQYDTKRYVALANASVTGQHDANQYLAKIGGGYPMQMGKVTITPMASLTYVNLDQAGYTETDRSNSGAALTVSSTKTDSFRSGLGAKVSVPLSEGAMKTAVEARAMWSHEFADTNQDIAARFAGGTSFTTNGVSQARDSANIGLGLNLSTANRQNLSVNYDAEVKSDYVGHTASVKFRYDF
jgi:outer membrane autotransporter protein